MKSKFKLFRDVRDVIKISNQSDRLYFPLVVLKSLITATFPFVGIVYSALILDGFIDGLSKETIMGIVYQMVIIGAILLIGRTILNFLCEQKTELISLKLKSEISRKTLNLDFQQLESQEMKDSISKANQGVMFTGGMGSFVNYLGATIENTISLIYSSILITTLFAHVNVTNPNTVTKIFNNPLIGVGIIILVFVSLYLNSRIIRKVNQLHYDIYDENIYMNRLFLYFRNASMDYKFSKDIRLFHLDHLLSNSINEFSNFFQNSYSRIAVKAGRMLSSGGILNNIILYTAYSVIGIKAILGLVSVGNVLLLVGAVTAFNTAVVQIINNISQATTQTKYLALYKRYLETTSQLYKGTLPVEKRDDGEYNFEFKNVTFHYPNNEDIILDNISWKIETGKKLAIVGPNGAGKTTFIKLLCRLYDPTEGEILLNGIDIRKYDRKEYIDLMSVVFQDFKLFSSTIYDNVKGGLTGNETEIIHCLDQAGLSNRLDSLSEGIDTYLYTNFGENGVEVSGGESQKIAIARALYKDSPLVILDEPTSALDPISEYEIYTKFDTLVDKKTSIYISHRMASCRFCSNIIVFNKGKIVQSGDHEELLRSSEGLYHKMWSAQAEYYNI